MKSAQIRALTDDEIQEKVSQLQKDLMNYRFQLKTGKLEKQSVIRSARRDVARLQTILSERKKTEVKK